MRYWGMGDGGGPHCAPLPLLFSTSITMKTTAAAQLNPHSSRRPPAHLAYNNNHNIRPGITQVHYLWGAPIEAVAIIALLASLVGRFSLPGIGCAR